MTEQCAMEYLILRARPPIERKPTNVCKSLPKLEQKRAVDEAQPRHFEKACHMGASPSHTLCGIREILLGSKLWRWGH